MKMKLYANGSFDLCSGNVVLRDCFPGIDGRPVRAQSVRVEGNTVCYAWDESTLTIRLEECENGGSMNVSYTGMKPAQWIEPVFGAALEGAENFDTQCFSSGDLTGMFPVNGGKPLCSYGLGVFGQKGNWLAVYTEDHRKDLFRITVAPAQVGREYSDTSASAGFGFRTETVNAAEGEFPVIFFAEFADRFTGKRECAKAIAEEMCARHVHKPAFHWCSWYYKYMHFCQDNLEEYTQGFKDHQIPFRYVQIDWCFNEHPGDWLIPGHCFPDGLKKAADTILEKGYQPGIWIAPFMASSDSKLVADHPDWLLRNLDGTPVVMIKQYHENKMWGLTDFELYALDTSHPDAMEYLRNVLTTFRSWGYCMYKTDFMSWGYHDSSKVIRHTPGKSGAEYFREALQMIRESIGEDAYWLGCDLPFYTGIGYADANRIGGDVGAQWVEGKLGPIHMIQEVFGDSYLNGIYFQNDPDVVLLRDFHVELKPHEIESLALLQAMSGGVIATSDPIHKISAERRELLEFIRANDEMHLVEIPEFDSQLRLMIQSLPQGKLLYAFNPTDQTLNEQIPVEEMLGKRYFLRQYHGENLGNPSNQFVSVRAHGGVLFFATEQELTAEPTNIWTF